MHRFEKCAYINLSVRPKGWTPDQEALERFERALQHPNYKYAYDRAIKLYQPNSSQPEETANAVAMLAVQKPQCYSTQHKPNLQAFDTAADVYICNDRSQFLTYEPYQSDVLVGDTRAPIIGIGLVRFTGFTQPIKNICFDLRECLYILGFHVNIISAQKAKKAGIYLNNRKNCLENQASQPIYGINDSDGITYIKQDCQPLIPEEKAAFSTSSDPIITKGTTELWHRRLGHPSNDAISHIQDICTGIEVYPSSDEKTSSQSETISAL